MYSNKILNFQESMTILNACPKKKSGNVLIAPRKMVESTWARIGPFLHHLDTDIRKIRRLERIPLKILKRKPNMSRE